MFAYLLTVVSAFIVGRAVRDALYLDQVPLERLPLMYCAVAMAVSLSGSLYGRMTDRFPKDRLIPAFLLVFALANAVFFVLATLQQAPTWTFGALYVAVEVMGALSIIQFWTLASEVFSGRQAKRLFGFIGAGGVLANVVCGFSVGALAPTIGTESLLLVGAGLYLLSFGWVLAAMRGSHQAPKNKGARKRAALEPNPVAQSPHLKRVSILVVVTFVTVTLVDYQFKVHAQASILSKSELTAFFGNFYGFVGLIACTAQFFLTGRVLEQAGLTSSLLILPGMMSLGVLSSLVLSVPSLVTSTLSKGAENIFRYTVNDASTQLLYFPVPTDRRGRAKATIDGVLKPLSIGLAGLCLFGMGTLFSPLQVATHLSGAIGVFLLGWISLVLSMRKHYVQALLDSLQRRRLGRAEPIATSVLKVQQRVRKAKEDIDRFESALLEEIREGFQLLIYQESTRSLLLEDALQTSIDHRMQIIFSLLELKYDARKVQLIQFGLQSRYQGTRANALEALESVLDRRHAKNLLTLIEELPRATRIERGLRLFPELQQSSEHHTLALLLSGSSPWISACAAHSVGQLGMQTLRSQVAPLCESRDPIVREAAQEALTRLGVAARC